MSVYRNFIKTNRRCRNKFMFNMVIKGVSGFLKYRRRMKKGKIFPAFQFISITNDCNLRCQGCWVSTGNSPEYMNADKINSIIESSKKQGSYFFGILGGEPLMYKQVSEIFGKHPDCYFQLFTNGTLFTESTASQLLASGNVTPLFSLEGDENVADIRRGGNHVYNRTLKAISTATAAGLITGVAVSVCKSNIEMALSDEFVMMLHDLGVLYVWYYIYRPAGSNPNYDLTLSFEDITRLRKFLVHGRTRLPMILIDSYWRANGEPFCPAADGLSHHINASGFIEPCPVMQIARENINDDGLPEEKYENSGLLRSFRKEIHGKTKGCILMEEPSWIEPFAIRQDAVNTSNRPAYFSDLKKAPVTVSHGSCPVIPEKSVVYRIAKRTAFFGMGSYG
ncbi:MAG TPA: radical SAM protein [Bacteroidales bacterium]|nr:radical SAM protein [Bacteroidales bacterium]